MSQRQRNALVVPENELSDSEDEGNRRNERNYNSNGRGESSSRKSRASHKNSSNEHEGRSTSSRTHKSSSGVREKDGRKMIKTHDVLNLAIRRTSPSADRLSIMATSSPSTNTSTSKHTIPSAPEVTTKQEPELLDSIVSLTQPQVEDTTNKTSDNTNNVDNNENDDDENNNNDIKDNKEEIKDDNNDKSNEPVAMEIDTNESLPEVKREPEEDVDLMQQ